MAINTPSLQYKAMAKSWALPNALWGDTPAMRAAGKTFLPQMPSESDDDYKTRLAETTLVNYFGTTINNLSGKVFQKPVVVDDSLKDVAAWLEDIDLEDSTISDFGLNVLRAGMRHGLTHILCDSPKFGEFTSLQEQQESGVRPYLVHIPADRLIGWDEVKINGVKTLAGIRITEQVIIDGDDFEQESREQIRHIFLNTAIDEDGNKVLTGGGGYEIWQDTSKNNKANFELVESGEVDMDYIPLVTYYTNRTGLMMGETYFKTLTHINHQHWQSSSYQRNILNVARVPRLFLSGFHEDEIKALQKHGVRNGLMSTKEEAKAQWVEAKGDAIAAGERDLADAEEKMQMLSLDPVLKPATNTQVATIANIEASKANSVLMQWAESLQGALLKAVNMMRDMAGLEEVEDGLKLHDNFEIIADMENRVKELREMRGAGDITQASFLTEVKRIGFFDESFDVEREVELTSGELGGL